MHRCLTCRPHPQSLGVKMHDIEAWIQKYEPLPENASHRRLGIDGFTRFMINELMIRVPSNTLPSRKLNEPLHHYAVFGSHNSYLEDGQTAGPGTAQAVASALDAGARCIECTAWRV